MHHFEECFLTFIVEAKIMGIEGDLHNRDITHGLNQSLFGGDYFSLIDIILLCRYVASNGQLPPTITSLSEAG